jgi:hypothetical protein
LKVSKFKILGPSWFLKKKKKSQNCQTNRLLSRNSNTQLTLEQGVCHTLALPFTLKGYLKAKEELGKLKYFTMQKCSLQKILKKGTKIIQDITTL